MSTIKRAALTLSAAALVTGATLAIPSTAMAAVSPTATSTTTSTHAPTTAASYVDYGSYKFELECNRVGLEFMRGGVISNYHCSGTPTLPGGEGIVWELWGLPV